MPGHPMDTRASGCNLLLRDGATLVRSAEDVIEALGPTASTRQPETSVEPPAPPPQPERPWRDRAALHSRILEQLGPAPVAEDQLLRDLGVSNGEAAPMLTTLELEGRITRQPGGLISTGDTARRGPKAPR